MVNIYKFNIEDLKKLKLSKLKDWAFPIIAIIGFIFALFIVFIKPDTPDKKPLIVPPVSTYNNAIAGIGVVEPRSELIAIGVELPGVVREVFVKAGDEVKKGEPLFSLDQRDIDAQIKILEANIVTAKILSEDATTQFALVSGIDDKRAVARDDYNRRKYAKESGISRINEINAELQRARITKERLVIRAPIDGRILKVDVRRGEYASARASALVYMGDMSRAHVRVEIDEENVDFINSKKGAIGYKRGDALKAIPLTFVRYEPRVLPKQNLAVAGQRIDTRVLQIIYALPDNYNEIFVGQQMDVFIDNTKDSKDK